MFNKMKATTLAVVIAAATLLGSEQAWAFDATFNSGNSGIVDSTVVVGNCKPAVFVVGAPTNTYIVRFNDPVNPGSPMQANPYWQNGNVLSRWSTFSPSEIETRCGLTNVVNFTMTTASGTPATNSYIGVSFRGTESDGSVYNYEYALSGATGTTFIQSRVLVDTTSPTVRLSSTTTTLNGVTPFTVTATFDEDVTGFTDIASDVTITNGTVTGITAVSASVYTLSVTPTGAGDVSISIPAAAAQDLASNNNTASTALVIGNTIIADTQRAIASFMLGRANHLVSNQPGLVRFMQNDGCSSFAASATNGAGAVSGCVSQGNTWAEITGSWSGDDSYTLGSFGAHSLMNTNLLVGAMLQVDYADDAANDTSGSGWMVGPYFVARIPEQPFFFEGRLLYGQSDNDVSLLGTFTDSFDTERFQAQLRATGEYNVQAFALMPLLDITYTDDTQKTYVDSLGNTITGQTVSLTQVKAGMNFATDVEVASGSLQLVGGLSGIYSSSAGAAASPKFENWRGRTHFGLDYGMATGGRLRASTFYDGIGTNYESYGVSLSFNTEF